MQSNKVYPAICMGIINNRLIQFIKLSLIRLIFLNLNATFTLKKKDNHCFSTFSERVLWKRPEEQHGVVDRFLKVYGFHFKLFLNFYTVLQSIKSVPLL